MGITGLGSALMQFFKGNWGDAVDIGKKAIYDLTGAGTLKKVVDGAKQIGKDAGKTYADELAKFGEKDNKEASAPSGIAGLVPSSTSTAGATSAATGSGSGAGTSGVSGARGNAPTQITIHKMFDNIYIQKGDFKESVEEMERMIDEAVIRVFKSVGLAIQ